MPRIIDRYLLRELLRSFVAVNAVLLLVTFGGVLTDVLNKIARGRFPAGLLLAQVGLRSLDGLAIILPLGLFLTVLLAYGRLYRDSEVAVLAASGLRLRAMLKPVLWLALPVLGLLAGITFVANPRALALADEMVQDANRSLLVAGLEAGRFVDLPGRMGVIYIGTMTPDGRRFTRLFVQSENDGRLDIITAAKGELYNDRAGRERYLRLEDGFRVEGGLDRPDFRAMRFARNDIRLPEPEAEGPKRVQTRRDTAALLTSTKRADQAELHWRLAMPVSALVLALLAFPLARSAPREPRFGRSIIAVLAYIVYVNLLALGRGWLADGSVPMAAGLWWVHAIALAVFAALYLVGARLPRPRAVRA
ncbi:MAG: LPS export ABC transporter permease LptF [Xanthomonadales bacterium]|nr:LPS export ABC transporter permease LptF [Xanthomonadales bacterium]MCC6561083.1 LPS export ABC transporter permease LptF [Xanthomonadales bacterium]